MLSCRINNLTFTILHFAKQAFINLNDLPWSTNGLDLGDHCIDADLSAEAGPVYSSVRGHLNVPLHGLQLCPAKK